jgi:hypothetical protein
MKMKKKAFPHLHPITVESIGEDTFKSHLSRNNPDLIGAGKVSRYVKIRDLSERDNGKKPDEDDEKD